MERKAWIAGVVAIAAVGVVAYAVWGGEEDGAGEAAQIERAGERPVDDATSGQPGTSSGEPSTADRDRARHATAARLAADGGVRPRRRPPIEQGDPAPSRRGELRQGLNADRSAGWRLGRARARIALVESRVARMRDAMAELERRGESAERQQVVLRRFETRLADLREEETELEAQATEDGTLGDVEQGMREGVAPRQAAPVRAQAPAD